MKPIKVAIAEDHSILRRTLTFGLEIKGVIEIEIEAENGKKLIEKIQDRDIDVVVLDVRMPEMDGFETLKHLKENYPDIKVIMFSSFMDDISVVQMARQLGANSFVSKSHPEKLIDCIREVYNTGYCFDEDYQEEQ